MFATASRLILEQHDRLLAIRVTAVHPHIRRVPCLSPLFLEDLDRRLVAVDQPLAPQNLLEGIVDPRIVQLGRADDPFASVPRLTAMFERASTSSIRYSGVPSTYLPAVIAAIIEGLARLPGKGCAGIGATTIGVRTP
ncbi:hypothetical protein WK53_26425 [Burkholderia ubonensis]|uniref:LysR substrate-binding domain-containing protein n=1 Tax=Burkholderia ubonensis TaxID=101571 RepID=A0AAW3NIA1_9BURK|nr:hypothetical protein WK53_26425 [Burkholderia ubonensis]